MSSSNKEKKLLSKYWYNMANFQKYDNLTNEYSSYIKDLKNDLKKLEASNRKGTLRGKNPSDYATEQDILEMKHNINNAVIEENIANKWKTYYYNQTLKITHLLNNIR